MKRPLAYITAPWSNNQYENAENAATYCRQVYDAGYSPICPVLFLSTFLKDEIPQEHKDGLDMVRDYRIKVLNTINFKKSMHYNDDIIICDPEAEYAPLVERLHGQVIKISPTSSNYINPMDLNLDYSDDESPLSLKSDFILSLCELIVGGKEGLQPVQKTIIDRCVRLNDHETQHRTEYHDVF